MGSRLKPLVRLADEQLRASDPRDLVWLSASAGTGKTHVLTARVLRLLLSGVSPETILCLTFTKAGAAEMADRIHARLASWVRLEEALLRKELFALGESNDEETVSYARTLFARVLDAPGGGLRIQTIHAFCQTLLAGFPSEAGLSPGFRPIEGRESAALGRRTLATLVAEAEQTGDLGLIDDLQLLSLRLGEEKTEAYLRCCANDPDALAALGPRPAILAHVRTALDVPLGNVEDLIEQGCCDDRFDCESLRAVNLANAEWATKTGLERADIGAAWLAMAPKARARALSALHLIWAKAEGGIRSFGRGAPKNADYEELASRLYDRCRALLDLRVRAATADLLAAGLRAGQAYALAYAEAKRAAGLVEFDDLIRVTSRLLQTDGMGDWVRYKLDQATDHILVDEAQDTNSRQWSIVAALAGEFFAGEGARPGRHRTIFTVGDFKQAIFGFQGTDPQAFRAAQMIFSRRAADVDREFVSLSLGRSFRSAPPVLEVVDGVIAHLGKEAMGIADSIQPHVSARDEVPGQVTIWQPLRSDDRDAGEDEGEEGWVDDATRSFAARLAQQVRTWISTPLWLAGKGRPLKPEDVLILVRKRGDLASLIVARLHAEGVPVAGVDRLRLNAPLAVRDLLAALRFAGQPEDDLSLANLLVSPLFGWSQDQLYAVAHGREGSLWRALRDSGVQEETRRHLNDILSLADYMTPHAFLEHLLSGPLQGRQKLVARLGEEVRDPIEELLNAALGFEREATPSIQRFLDWFDRGEVDITRDPSAPQDAVRVMTVHGSKGLQAPVVILADATADPSASRRDIIDWQINDISTVPIVRPSKTEREASDQLAAALAEVEGKEMEEHWRLLYVALTRAEEHLYVGGALSPRMRGKPPEKSWYCAIDGSMAALGAELVDDPIWGGARHYHGRVAGTARKQAARRKPIIPEPVPPAWLSQPAPQEARPPRPLAPSAIGVDLVADPPAGPALAEAARRGRLLHALFERLPPISPEERVRTGTDWLIRSAGVEDERLAAELVGEACRIMNDPAFAAIFGPDSLAEAPIAAVVGEDVIAGTVDRLLVTDDRILVVDFKTTRRVPANASRIAEQHVVQMAAYVAALESIFPGRPVEAALLYTSGPTLFVLPASRIDMAKPGFQGEQEKLSLGR